MLPKLIGSLAATVPLLVCLPVHAQPGTTQLAMLTPFAPRPAQLDSGIVRVKGNGPDVGDWPIIHGPSYLPMWTDESASRDGKSAPLHSDRFHFHFH